MRLAVNPKQYGKKNFIFLVWCAALFITGLFTAEHASARDRHGKNINFDKRGDHEHSHVGEHWIAAEIMDWDYAPSGQNLINPNSDLGPWGEIHVYRKYRYVEYTDGSYATPVPQPSWMGILGPPLRAVEGDRIVVHFKNQTDKPLSMHPHGLRYTEENDGADFPLRGEDCGGCYVKPGESWTYTWFADHGAAPGKESPSSTVWLYHSHVDSVQEIYDGLIGTIIVTKKGMSRSGRDPRPRDVDEEFTTLFMVFDEEDGEEGGLMHSINGFIFGNLQGLTVHRGERVRWHLIALGTEVDLHTAHWHGETVYEGGWPFGRRTDVVELLPASMKTVDMYADNPGTWLFHCHVADHITAGMTTRWEVR